MRLVTLLLGILAVGAVALVLSIYGYARQGSATPASDLGRAATANTPIASPSPPASGPELAAPTPVIAALPDATASGGGPVAMAAQSEAPALPTEPADPTAAPASRDRHTKHQGGGHGKHDHSGGD
ncbi:MAG: hypothetical protein DLM67_09310 [Candidatus Nephthysia bennettiae]|uniref:Uncharacterized protein n=1 Tax=Candidatus Nephthysia bennettiae TaxID=3127016 RepID=A0A934NC53_9BACT|nr:hypothetical protein [Candidatus Dormibacteraeota bacterium]MBJ7613598.1 hypothetical protein [Candidatus Dormibacteraeota bacterium]PZR96628.1 MAG: hypothetical protein DLM67_09310 [Candidatus Dormibacteraeota bacterium]